MSKIIKIEREVPEVSYELIEGIIKNLQGHVLTVTEAVVSNDKLTATKSLIKNHFNDSLTRTFEVFMNNGLVEEAQLPDYER